MKKILLLGSILLATISLTDNVFAHYRDSNYQNNYTYNSQYTIRQISPCLSYKYNYYGQLIETINTCNNNYSYPAYQASNCTQIQTYPYINNCNSNYNNNYQNYYPSYNNCSYYYYDTYGNYTCGTYNSNSYYPSINYIPTNYNNYPYYYGY